MASIEEKTMFKSLDKIMTEFKPYNGLLVEIASKCDGPDAIKYRWLFEKTYAEANEHLQEIRAMAVVIRAHAPEYCNKKTVKEFLEFSDTHKVFDLPVVEGPVRQ